MSNYSQAATDKRKGLGSDFWKFWTGQVISGLGSAFTNFALPILIYRLTGSALNLALAMTATFLPYLLFGLVIGAWVDRTNRKRLMIFTDIARMLVVGSIPLLASQNLLSIWWLYIAEFIGSTLTICFNSAQFAAIPSLVSNDDLVTANGRIQASFSATGIVGPLLAGLLTAIIDIPMLLIFDALSFGASAISLALILRSFNSAQPRQPSSLRQDIGEGLRYVWSHPVLRNISLMMALVNLVASNSTAQLILFSRQQLHADNTQYGLLNAAGSVGVIVLSLLAGNLRKHFSFSKVALGALMSSGVVGIFFAISPWYWVSLVLWALIMGLGVLFNINTSSLRQAIVPNEMLGRVMSIAGVLAWSAIPVGTFLGGLLLDQTQNPVLVYALIGLFTTLIPIGFAFTPLGHAERYLPVSATPSPDAASQLEEAIL